MWDDSNPSQVGGVDCCNEQSPFEKKTVAIDNATNAMGEQGTVWDRGLRKPVATRLLAGGRAGHHEQRAAPTLPISGISRP